MTIDEKIEEAEQALHRIELEGAAIEISTEQGTTKFTRVNKNELSGYISRLKARRDGRPERGAITFTYC
ncbi:hypothetical protein [Maricaulis maris]|uniref:hypothetical protein n=1 Tax=Maricaulis maris TaxID=74318 RepID=UPI003B8C6D06